MKKNKLSSSTTARILRVENLESRQMLSVAPWNVPATDAVVAASETVDDEPIDLNVDDPETSPVETSTLLTVGDYDPAARLATIVWDADEAAVGYSVQISRNGGETWLDYAQALEEPSVSVSNVVPGRDYAFRVAALDAEGETTTTYDELAFSPIDMAVSDDAFMLGETISLALSGSENADADIVWYYVVNDELVEIEDAQGQYEYKPTQTNDVLVVATGLGASEGCVCESTVSYVVEHASTVVTTLDDVVDARDGVVSLREAVTLYAQEGETIVFDDTLAGGTIALTGRQIDVATSVTIDASAVGGVTLDAGGVSRVFQTTANQVDLVGLTLVNGYSQSVGGAIYASAGAALNLTSVRIVDSVAGFHGGAIYANAGLAVSATNVEITDNAAAAYGSAICAYGAQLQLNGVTIAGNASEQSQGAIYLNNGADCDVYNSIVVDNEGGDVFVGRSSNTIVNAYSVLTSYTQWSNGEEGVVAYNPEAGLFADAENGDYTLSNDSQAMDAGENAYVTTDVDLAGNERVQCGVVDLGAYEFAGSQIAVAYNASTRQADLTWLAIPGATSYTLLLSRDGAEPVEYAKGLTELATSVNGLFVGSSYDFRAIGIAEDGSSLTVYRQKTFAPIGLSVESGSFDLGDAVVVSLLGAENAKADVRWYEVTEDGDVEIAEAAGALEYTPTSNLYDLRVVATGIGASLGSDASLTIGNLASKIDVDYDAATRQAVLAWEAIDGVASYKIRLSRDGGETWIDYAKGVEGLTATVNGLWAGREIGFRVYGETETGTTLAYREAAFTPINLKSETDVFSAGDTIAVELKGAASAAAEIAWYYVTEDGDVEIEEAAGLLEFAPEIDFYDVKVVAAGIGASEGATATLLFSSDAPAVDFLYSADVRQTELSWRPIDGAAGYRVKISRDGGESWITYLRDVDGTTATVNGLYAGKSYSFRAYAVDENGVATDAYREGTFAPIAVDCYHTFTAGETVSITLRGAENASADVYWVAIAGDASYEIEEARGLLEYAPTNDLYNIGIVAIGTGESDGSFAQTIVYSAGAPTAFDYDAENHAAILAWRPIDDAVIYKVQISRDGGETWYQYAKNISGLSQQVNGLYVSKSYEFRVIGYDANGTKLDAIYDASFTPVDDAADVEPASESLLDEAFAEYFVDEI